MRLHDNDTRPRSITLPPAAAGLTLAALGVLGFSLSFPATRLALEGFGPLVVGLGRAAIAGVAAALWLLVGRSPPPQRRDLVPLAKVALGVVVGFPTLSAVALQSVPAGHASITIGVLPLATAALGVARTGERMPRAFWAAAGVGGALVVALAAARSGASVGLGDALLFGGTALAAVGYAEGGDLARRMGGPRVISWALVLSLPITAPVALVAASFGGATPSARACLGLGYVSLVSMFLAFFAWYQGMAKAGVARASQVQLVQPIAGLGWSWLLLGEPASGTTLLAGVGVVACAATASSVARGVRPSRRAP